MKFNKLSGRKLIIVLVAFMLIMLSFAMTSCQEKEDTVKEDTVSIEVDEWVEDAKQLKHDIEWYNASPYERYGKEAFEREYGECIKAIADADTEEAKEFELRKLIYTIGDGHMDIWNIQDRMFSIPIMINKLSDGSYYIVNTTEEYKELFGKEVKFINGQPVARIIDKFGKISNSESEEWKLANALDKLHFKRFYVLSGYADETDTALVVDGVSVSFTGTLSPESWHKKFGVNNLTNFTFWAEHTQTVPYSTAWYDDDRVLVIEFRDFYAEKEDLSLYEWGLQVRREVEDKKPEVLLLDLRSNGGGSPSALYTALPESFFREAGFMNNPNFFVATNRQTFSAAVSATNFVKNTWGATHIGTATGGSVYTTIVSSTAQKELKNSGLRFRVSSGSVNKKINESPTVVPSVILDAGISDIEKDRDVVIDYVIEQTKNK